MVKKKRVKGRKKRGRRWEKEKEKKRGREADEEKMEEAGERGEEKKHGRRRILPRERENVYYMTATNRGK